MDTAVSVHRLRVFRAVAERHSFTLAAADLNTTQPAVSRVIQLLEAATGVPLFHRQPSAVVLTEAGEHVYRYAMRVLEATAELERSLSDLNGAKVDRLAIGAGPILGVYLLPPLMAGFRELHPGLQISLRTDTADQLVPRLLAFELDLLMLGHLPDGADQSSIVAQKYFVDELDVVVGKGHRLAGADHVSLDTLRSLPFVLPEPGSWLRGIIDGHLRHLGLRPKVVLELDQTEAIKRSVQANVGVGYLSKAAIGQELAAGVLHVLKVDGPALVQPVYMMYSSRRTLPTVARQFVAYCRRARRET